MGPLRRLANTIGRDAKLSTRGTLIDGELRSAQGPGSAPPVWFVFTGVQHCVTSSTPGSLTGCSLWHHSDVMWAALPALQLMK